MQDAVFCSKNMSFDHPPKRGHFSCGKLVPHLRASTVSHSEASTHLAHVQHLWQSKLFVIFKGLARWRIGLCSEMQLARQWLQMHFVMHVCWQKKLLCRWSLAAKNLQILHHVLDPKMGVEKWTQKWCQNLTPKLGSKNGAQKGAQYLDQEEIKTLYIYIFTTFLGAIFGPHFGGQILAPFLGPFFNPHFGVQNMVQNLQIFATKAHLHSNFFRQKTCITKCICSHCL